MFKLNLRLNENPIPYKRTTQRAKWVDKDYQKYLAFKELLKTEFHKQNKESLKPKTPYAFRLKIGFKDKRHGDADNVVKGVLDALFKNDKFVLKGEYEVVSFKEAFLELEIDEFAGKSES